MHAHVSSAKFTHVRIQLTIIKMGIDGDHDHVIVTELIIYHYGTNRVQHFNISIIEQSSIELGKRNNTQYINAKIEF